ncbi:MAG TPA: hypothetical protein VNQ90_07845 [Chthoniobacteraceae bacterium]|nr:hypothetical protein [Chthoniobacteraceae bacterium]
MTQESLPASALPETLPPLAIGWAEVDITPASQPVAIAGQFPARLSEGVLDPLKATACALEQGGEQVVFVACDLVSISDELRTMTRERLAQGSAGPDPLKVVFNATHTHTGPECRLPGASAGHTSAGGSGVDIGERSVKEYLEFASGQLAACVEKAWAGRAPGGAAFGLDDAVVGRNRRWVDADGVSTMYRLNAPASERFRHIEGYEDHSLNLLATYDEGGRLRGLIVNLPSPSQEQGSLFSLSADFWYEARAELRRRFGEGLFILPQVSAAGELTSHALYEKAARQRMLRLRGVSERQEIANRIADGVGRILPHLEAVIERNPLLRHRVDSIALPLNRLSEADVADARQAAEELRLTFEEEVAKLEANPELKKEPRWYVPATAAYRRMSWYLGVAARAELQKTAPFKKEEVHFLRLGDIAFASNPFEYYLDYGVQIKVRSPALQTFLIQLAGQGTYLPSPRSVAGGGYGSVPASNPHGPEAGQILADATVNALRELWGCAGS